MARMNYNNTAMVVEDGTGSGGRFFPLSIIREMEMRIARLEEMVSHLKKIHEPETDSKLPEDYNTNSLSRR